MDTLRAALNKAGIDSRTLDRLGTFHPPVYQLTVKGKNALNTWSKLRAAVDGTKSWPVILGPPEDVASYLEDEGNIGEHAQTVEEILQAAAKLTAKDAADDLALKFALNLPLPPTPPPDESGGDEDDIDPELAHELGPIDWPADDDVVEAAFSVPFDMETEEPWPELVIALVPTPRAWEVPAFLHFGDYNSCPPAWYHCAVLKRWNETHGAELVCLTHDVLELKVTKPPTTKEAARTLAFIHEAYAPDVVDQGVGTTENLAKTLLRAPTWFFWWD